LHYYCVGRTWFSGAPMILVEVNSVASGWIRQQTLPGAIFNPLRAESAGVYWQYQGWFKFPELKLLYPYLGVILC
jgi:hypothetical protein